MKKFKYVSIIIVFSILVFGAPLWHFLTPDKELSTAERRLLEQAPTLSFESVFSGKYMRELEAYMLDQFPSRDDFRAIKANFGLNILFQKDNNKIYSVDGILSKLDYPLKVSEAEHATEKFNSIQEKFLSNCKVYYSVIPDKNYFLAAQNSYPSMDYPALMKLLEEKLQNMEYIDIFDTVDIGDFYKTDTHWRQEKIYKTAERLALGMDIDLIAFEQYTQHKLAGFSGVYQGQSALSQLTETMIYLTNNYIDNATMISAENGAVIPIYDLEKYDKMDGYDIFLSGSQPLLTINCENAESDRELIVFRDSFGGAIVPYFIGAYSKITVVDIRYVMSDYLDTFIDFSNQDVLFLHSATVYNIGTLFK